MLCTSKIDVLLSSFFCLILFKARRYSSSVGVSYPCMIFRQDSLLCFISPFAACSIEWPTACAWLGSTSSTLGGLLWSSRNKTQLVFTCSCLWQSQHPLSRQELLLQTKTPQRLPKDRRQGLVLTQNMIPYPARCRKSDLPCLPIREGCNYLNRCIVPVMTLWGVCSIYVATKLVKGLECRTRQMAEASDLLLFQHLLTSERNNPLLPFHCWTLGVFSHRLPVESSSSPEESTAVIMYFVSSSFNHRSFLTHLIFLSCKWGTWQQEEICSSPFKTKQEQHILHESATF